MIGSRHHAVVGVRGINLLPDFYEALLLHGQNYVQQEKADNAANRK